MDSKKENKFDWLEDVERLGYTQELENLRRQIEMQKKSEILRKHKFAISKVVEHRKQGDIVRWRSHLPDANGKKGRQIIKAHKQDLEDAIVDFYREQDKSQIPTLDDVYKEWRDWYFELNNSSNNTREKYHTDYERFFIGSSIIKKPITDITDIDIEDFFLKSIKSYKSRDNKIGLEYRAFGRLYGYMNGLFRYAYKHRMIENNPMLYLDKSDFRNACRQPKEKSAQTELISDNDFDAILKQLYKDMQDNPTYFPTYAVELGALTGMRVAELATLKWEDINEKEGYIEIKRSDKFNRGFDENGKRIYWWTVEKTKTGKKRRFPLDDEIRNSLNRIRKIQFQYGLVSEWVFPHPEYGWTHNTIISSCLKNKCLQIGLKRTYGIHAFRKTLNSDLRMQNVPAKMCASMIGNTADVNDAYYYYDTSNMDDKRAVLSQAHKKRNFA